MTEGWSAGRHHVLGIIPDAVNRHPQDFYRTPEWATEALLDRETFGRYIWEPACGDGAISEVLRQRGYEVKSTDLHDRGYGEWGVDFLTVVLPAFERIDAVVTNPPFRDRYPERFVHHALLLGVPKVAILARVLWLEGQARRDTLFRPAPPRAVYVFSSRVNVCREDFRNLTDGHGGMVAYAWYVWESGFQGETALRWI